MRIERYPGRDDIALLHVDGGINGEIPEDLMGDVLGMIDTGVKWMVVDCSAMPFVSSAGLGVLLKWHKRLKERGGEARLACVAEPVQDLLKMTCLDSVFAVHPDIGHAADAFPG